MIGLFKTAPKHCKMRYTFPGMEKAFGFRDLLASLNLPATAGYREREGWFVETDSRCLEHAPRLAPFIYKAGRR